MEEIKTVQRGLQRAEKGDAGAFRNGKIYLGQIKRKLSEKKRGRYDGMGMCSRLESRAPVGGKIYVVSDT